MEINEEVKLLREIVRNLHEMVGSIPCNVSCLRQAECQELWASSKKAIDQFLADDAKAKGEDAVHGPTAIEKLAREIHGLLHEPIGMHKDFDETCYQSTLLDVARHVQGMIDKHTFMAHAACETEWRCKIQDLKNDHAIALKAAKREALHELGRHLHQTKYQTDELDEFLKRYIAQLDAEEKG